MLDDYKYSIGRLVVYRHTEPKLPRQSYGHYGPERTLGEIEGVETVSAPQPHWLYAIRNIRNQELTHVTEDEIKFATSIGSHWRKSPQQIVAKAEDGALAEMIARALANPERAGLLRGTLKDMLHREDLAARASREGPNLPIGEGDYVRLRGDLRPETEPLHSHYAKILSVKPSDIAGIENPQAKQGQPRIFRTHKQYHVLSSEGVEADVYDAEIKLFYTAKGRKTILNWRAATLLSETFKDPPPYNPEYEFLMDHVFTREELKPVRRSELAHMLSSLLYVKGKMGWRDYQRRGQFFVGSPKSHLIDNILEISRFDSRRNRCKTIEEIAEQQQASDQLRRLFAGS